MFGALLRGLQPLNDEKQQLIISHFYRIVCCEQEKNTKLMHLIWSLYLQQENQKAALNIRQEGQSEERIEIGACFWGMLQGAVYTMAEKELTIFIEVFLEFRRQGIAAYSITVQPTKEALGYSKATDTVQCENKIVEKILKEELLRKRCCLFLIFLECRFRMEAPATVELAALVERLKEYGGDELDRMRDSDIWKNICRFVEGTHQQEVIKDIVNEMIDDRRNGTSRCCINNFPAISSLNDKIERKDAVMHIRY